MLSSRDFHATLPVTLDEESGLVGALSKEPVPYWSRLRHSHSCAAVNGKKNKPLPQKWSRSPRARKAIELPFQALMRGMQIALQINQ